MPLSEDKQRPARKSVLANYLFVKTNALCEIQKFLIHLIHIHFFFLCIAAHENFILSFVRFPEETESESFFWEKVKDIYHETRCHALCFTPDTSLMIIPKNVTFCAAGSDFLLRIFRTDLQNSDTVQTLKGHTNYVNEISWSNKCEFLELVSDDNSCKIWCFESNYDNIITFCLSSAGMSVKWHPDDPNKVMVAEKKGVIHMYNVRSQQSVISVECPKIPLLTADWALNNYHIITALSNSLQCMIHVPIMVHTPTKNIYFLS
ncbi:nucleoporin Nup37-like [Glossina fuscipes fuscipes]